MKKFEFRCWDGNKMMHNVGIHPHIIERHEDYEDGQGGQFTVSPSFDCYKIMQYINAKDKYGDKIFENDIVIWSYIKNRKMVSFTCKVVYDDKEFIGYVLKPLDKGNAGYIPIGMYGAKPSELEVLGNIYENLKIKFKNHEN
jgi:uncharacterized phage protein (TIGR01671 family)